MIQHFYDTNEMGETETPSNYTQTRGAWVEGERVLFAKMTHPAGSSAGAHSHPNEQFILILSGHALFNIEGDEKQVGPGEIVYIPANAVHHNKVIGDENLVFATAKDTSWGLTGIAVEDQAD